MEYRLARCCTPREPDHIVGLLKQDEDVDLVILRHHLDLGPDYAAVVARRTELVTQPRSRAPTMIQRGLWSGFVGPRLRGGDKKERGGDRPFPCHARVGGHPRMNGWASPPLRAGVTTKGTLLGQPRFVRHRRLRDPGLLRRVQPRIIQYRKGIVDGTWIKHRNHTCYGLTDMGKAVLAGR